MAKRSKKIPAGAPASGDRQPAQGEASASTPAGSPSGEGPERTGERAGLKADAVARASEPSSTDAPGKSDVQGGSGDPAAPADDMSSGDLSAWVREGGINDVRRQFPLCAAALSEWASRQLEVDQPTVRIVAKRDGFRRAGMAHSKAGVSHMLSDLRPEQLEQLLSEPMLVVELV